MDYMAQPVLWMHWRLEMASVPCESPSNCRTVSVQDLNEPKVVAGSASHQHWLDCVSTQADCRQAFVAFSNNSVPARHISEGAAPCPYWLAPCPIYTRPARITDSRCKNACKMLADLCSCFHQSPQDQILVVHA